MRSAQGQHQGPGGVVGEVPWMERRPAGWCIRGAAMTSVCLFHRHVFPFTTGIKSIPVHSDVSS